MSDMAIEQGVVTEVDDDKALVELTPDETCENCNARFFCRPGSGGTKKVLAYNPLKARAGQKVEIQETGNLLLKTSLMQFGLPLLGLIVGIFSVSVFDFSDSSIAPELLMSFGGLSGLLLAGSASWLWFKHIARNLSCVFEITAVKSRI